MVTFLPLGYYYLNLLTVIKLIIKVHRMVLLRNIL